MTDSGIVLACAVSRAKSSMHSRCLCITGNTLEDVANTLPDNEPPEVLTLNSPV